MSKELQIKSYSLANPEEVKQASLVIKDYVKKNQLSVSIQGKDYTMTEGWQFSGGLMGLYPVITEVKDLSKEAEVKWMATCEVVNKEGVVVSRGFAVCSNKEMKKRSFDEYAVLSMAQTRAVGKSFRNIIGWIMKMAGFESTPAEEMPQQEKVKVSKTDYEKAVLWIGKTNDAVKLDSFRDNIFANENLSEEERSQLIDMAQSKIDGLSS